MAIIVRLPPTPTASSSTTASLTPSRSSSEETTTDHTSEEVPSSQTSTTSNARPEPWWLNATNDPYRPPIYNIRGAAVQLAADWSRNPADNMPMYIIKTRTPRTNTEVVFREHDLEVGLRKVQRQGPVEFLKERTRKRSADRIAPGAALIKRLIMADAGCEHYFLDRATGKGEWRCLRCGRQISVTEPARCEIPVNVFAWFDIEDSWFSETQQHTLSFARDPKNSWLFPCGFNHEMLEESDEFLEDVLDLFYFRKWKAEGRLSSMNEIPSVEQHDGNKTADKISHKQNIVRAE